MSKDNNSFSGKKITLANLQINKTSLEEKIKETSTQGFSPSSQRSGNYGKAANQNYDQDKQTSNQSHSSGFTPRSQFNSNNFATFVKPFQDKKSPEVKENIQSTNIDKQSLQKDEKPFNQTYTQNVNANTNSNVGINTKTNINKEGFRDNRIDFFNNKQQQVNKNTSFINSNPSNNQHKDSNKQHHNNNSNPSSVGFNKRPSFNQQSTNNAQKSGNNTFKQHNPIAQRSTAQQTAGNKPFQQNNNKPYNASGGHNAKFQDYKKKSTANKPHKSGGQKAGDYNIKNIIKSISNTNIDLEDNTGEILGNVLNVKLATIPLFHNPYKEKITRKGSGSSGKSFDHISREIIINDNQIDINDFAHQLAIKKHFLLQKARSLGVHLSFNEVLNGDTAQLIAEELGHTVKRIGSDDVEKDFLSNVLIKGEDLRERPPIVTIMGHVDHGKTSLLDYIRKASIVQTEAGGITQHIGAYRTKVGDKYITFIDTPGHAAFTEMRARGAKVTDIVVIVVAADDGIMPQTVEAINHAKAANVSIIVAINKVDKPDANINKVKESLMAHNLIAEDFGGDIPMIGVSALKGTNIDQLLDTILIQAEMMQLQSYYDGAVSGFVIESKIDKKRGVLATLIVSTGTLSVGDTIVIESSFGKVRAMSDENGNSIKEATPSTPVEIMGLNTVPFAGSIFYVAKNEKQANDFVDYHKEKQKVAHQKDNSLTKADLLNLLKGSGDISELKKINIIIKADTHGSLEAVIGMLSKIENKEVELKILHSAVGLISESDVLLAKTSNALVVSFGGKNSIPKNVLESADKNSVEVRHFDIIYQLVDDVKDFMSGALKPKIEFIKDGQAEIKHIFELSNGKIAGCIVKSGLIKRSSIIRILRNKQLVCETEVDTLKKQKDDVKEVSSGHECGMKFTTFKDFQIGDVIESFHKIEKKQYV